MLLCPDRHQGLTVLLSPIACIQLPVLTMQRIPGIIETSPGVRSCMIEYDQRILPLSELLTILEKIDKELPAVSLSIHLHLRKCCITQQCLANAHVPPCAKDATLLCSRDGFLQCLVLAEEVSGCRL